MTLQQSLEDGTPYVGQLGELAYDPDEDKVQCHLCGGWYRAIGSSHLRQWHGWTLEAYRDAFRLPMQLASCSRGVSQQMRTNALRLIERGDFGTGLWVPIERRSVRIRPWRTLAARHPELVRELDSERNGPIDPTGIAAKSSRKLWWRCADCGHEWQATVGSRAVGHGCPECYDQRRRDQGARHVSAGRSLQALYPELAAEWDQARNRGLDPAAISPKSGRKVWWRCGTCGHRWPALMQNRANGHGCPRCGLERRARTQSRVAYDRSLAARYPSLVTELHPTGNPGLDPKQLGARSSLRVWWRCGTCGHDWKATVSSRTYAGTGCPVCGLTRRARTQSEVDPARSLALRHPEIAAQLHPSRNQGIDPAHLGARSSLKLWWRCGTCGHEWRTAVSTRTDGSGCPACYRARPRHRQHAVANTHPLGNVGNSPARSTTLPVRAGFADAAHVPSIRSMRTTQQIVQSIDQRLGELNDEIKTLDAARVALNGHENQPTSRPAASMTSRRKPTRASSQTQPSAKTRHETSANAAAESAPQARKRAHTTSGARRSETLATTPAERVESLLSAKGGLSTAAVAEKTGGKRDHMLTLLRELETAGRVRRTGQRRATRWHTITDEDRIRERAAELEATRKRPA
jgi:predicted  nucleic acid-binding Zn-ribbon protein